MVFASTGVAALYAALFTVVFAPTGGGAVIKLSGNSVKSRALHQSSTPAKKTRKKRKGYWYSVLAFNFQRTNSINDIYSFHRNGHTLGLPNSYSVKPIWTSQ